MVTKYYGKVRIDWTDEEWARLTAVKRNRPHRKSNPGLLATVRSLSSEIKCNSKTRKLAESQPDRLWGFDASVYSGSHRRTLNEVRCGLREAKWLL